MVSSVMPAGASKFVEEEMTSTRSPMLAAFEPAETM